MSISFDSALGVHPYALDVRAERARILAGNLANVDTPGYLARDVDYKTILGRVAQQVAAGEESQAINQGTMRDDMRHPLYRIPYQVSMDGNSAELGG